MHTLTIRQAEDRYGVSRSMLYRYARDGLITPHKSGGLFVSTWSSG